MRLLRYVPKIIAAPIKVILGAWKFAKWVHRLLAPKKKSRYTSDWSSVSTAYKESQDWTCGDCGVVLCRQENRHLLHVHHRNRNSLDNSRRNLVALCVQCHSKQPGVGHRRLRTASKTDGRWSKIDQIRKGRR